jgi:hypothetical protein
MNTANPVPEPGHSVLDAAHEYLGRFVAYPDPHAHAAHTLWAAHAHLMGSWDSTPRLAFISPEPGSGKTRALEAMAPLVPRPLHSTNASTAYLFRSVSSEDGPPTVLFDEVDTIFGFKPRPDSEDLRGFLNSGHRRGATMGRCEIRGKTIVPVEYPSYCAVAVAGLGNLPDTLADRSIIIHMRRMAPAERVEAWRHRLHHAEGDEIRRRLAGWAGSYQGTVTKILAELAGDLLALGIDGRQADAWEDLLAVADAAGGDWPRIARDAAAWFAGTPEAKAPSRGVSLLADLRTVFDESGAAFVPSTEALDALAAMPEAPWSEWRGGNPLTARGLSTLLAPYGVRSAQIRMPGAQEAIRGYRRRDLEDPWARYLAGPSEAGGEPDRPQGLGTVTSVTDVTQQVRGPENCHGSDECSGSIRDNRDVDRSVTVVTDVTQPPPAAGADPGEAKPVAEPPFIAAMCEAIKGEWNVATSRMLLWKVPRPKVDGKPTVPWPANGGEATRLIMRRAPALREAGWAIYHEPRGRWRIANPVKRVCHICWKRMDKDLWAAGELTHPACAPADMEGAHDE